MEVSTEQVPVAVPCAAGFWRRSAAFIIDATLIGVVGALLGWALFDLFAHMGVYARVVGFALALAYFGVMNSVLSRGQSLGKRLLGVRVVGGHGKLLSLPKSLLRYAVLGVPFFLNGAQFGTSVLLSPVAYLLSLAVFGGIFSILYLYLFNRHGRRSMHDLAVGSSVVTAQSPVAAVRPAPVWRVHLAVVGVILVASAVVPYFTTRMLQNDTFKDLWVAYEALNAESGIQYAQVSHNTSFGFGGNPNVESVVAVVRLSERRIEDSAFAQHIAQVILANDKKAKAMSAIHVTLVYGYDMGISSGWRTQSYQFTPDALASGVGQD